MSFRILALLALGLLAVSTASIFARLLPLVPAVAIAFWRLGSASAILWGYTCIRRQPPLLPAQRGKSWLAGLFLGLHFACFFGALKLTSIAHATVLATMAPVFTVILERSLLGRTWNRRIVVGLVFALAGVIIIQGGSFRANGGSYLGDGLALISSLWMALVLLLAEQVRRDTATLTYSRSLYLGAALTVLLLAVLLGESLPPNSPTDIFWLLMLGLVPTVLGHTSFYHAVKFVRPTVVASIPLGEPLVASTLGWIIFGEGVPLATLCGGILLLGGLSLIIRAARGEPRGPR